MSVNSLKRKESQEELSNSSIFLYHNKKGRNIFSLIITSYLKITKNFPNSNQIITLNSQSKLFHLDKQFEDCNLLTIVLKPDFIEKNIETIKKEILKENQNKVQKFLIISYSKVLFDYLRDVVKTAYLLHDWNIFDKEIIKNYFGIKGYNVSFVYSKISGEGKSNYVRKKYLKEKDKYFYFPYDFNQFQEYDNSITKTFFHFTIDKVDEIIEDFEMKMFKFILDFGRKGNIIYFEITKAVFDKIKIKDIFHKVTNVHFSENLLENSDIYLSDELMYKLKYVSKYLYLLSKKKIYVIFNKEAFQSTFQAKDFTQEKCFNILQSFSQVNKSSLRNFCNYTSTLYQQFLNMEKSSLFYQDNKSENYRLIQYKILNCLLDSVNCYFDIKSEKNNIFFNSQGELSFEIYDKGITDNKDIIEIYDYINSNIVNNCDFISKYSSHFQYYEKLLHISGKLIDNNIITSKNKFFLNYDLFKLLSSTMKLILCNVNVIINYLGDIKQLKSILNYFIKDLVAKNTISLAVEEKKIKITNKNNNGYKFTLISYVNEADKTTYSLKNISSEISILNTNKYFSVNLSCIYLCEEKFNKYRGFIDNMSKIRLIYPILKKLLGDDPKLSSDIKTLSIIKGVFVVKHSSKVIVNNIKVILLLLRLVYYLPMKFSQKEEFFSQLLPLIKINLNSVLEIHREFKEKITKLYEIKAETNKNNLYPWNIFIDNYLTEIIICGLCEYNIIIIDNYDKKGIINFSVFKKGEKEKELNKNKIIVLNDIKEIKKICDEYVLFNLINEKEIKEEISQEIDKNFENYSFYKPLKERLTELFSNFFDNTTVHSINDLKLFLNYVHRENYDKNTILKGLSIYLSGDPICEERYKKFYDINTNDSSILSLIIDEGMRINQPILFITNTEENKIEVIRTIISSEKEIKMIMYKKDFEVEQKDILYVFEDLTDFQKSNKISGIIFMSNIKEIPKKNLEGFIKHYYTSQESTHKKIDLQSLPLYNNVQSYISKESSNLSIIYTYSPLKTKIFTLEKIHSYTGKDLLENINILPKNKIISIDYKKEDLDFLILLSQLKGIKNSRYLVIIHLEKSDKSVPFIQSINTAFIEDLNKEQDILKLICQNEEHFIYILKKAYFSFTFKTNNEKDMIRLKEYVNQNITILSKSFFFKKLVFNHYKDYPSFSLNEFIIYLVYYIENESIINFFQNEKEKFKEQFFKYFKIIKEDEIVVYFDIKVPFSKQKITKLIFTLNDYIEKERIYTTIKYFGANLTKEKNAEFTENRRKIKRIINYSFFKKEKEEIDIDLLINDIVIMFTLFHLKEQFQCVKIIKEILKKRFTEPQDVYVYYSFLFSNTKYLFLFCKIINSICDLYSCENVLFQLKDIDSIVLDLSSRKLSQINDKDFFLQLFIEFFQMMIQSKDNYVEVSPSGLISIFKTFIDVGEFLILNIKNSKVLNDIVSFLKGNKELILLTSFILKGGIQELNEENTINTVIEKINEKNSNQYKKKIYLQFIKVITNSKCLGLILYDVFEHESLMKESYDILTALFIYKKQIFKVSFNTIEQSKETSIIFNIYLTKNDIKINSYISNVIILFLDSLLTKFQSEKEEIKYLKENNDIFSSHLINFLGFDIETEVKLELLISIVYIKHYIQIYSKNCLKCVEIAEKINSVFIGINEESPNVSVIKQYILKCIYFTSGISLSEFNFDSLGIPWVNRSQFISNTNALGLEPTILSCEEKSVSYILDNILDEIDDAESLSNFISLINQTKKNEKIKFSFIQFVINKIYLGYTSSNIAKKKELYDKLFSKISLQISQNFSNFECLLINNLFNNFTEKSNSPLTLLPSTSRNKIGLTVLGMTIVNYVLCFSSATFLDQIFCKPLTDLASLYIPGGHVEFHDENIFYLIGDINENFHLYGTSIGLYECKCGFFYTIGNCTRPYVLACCPQCGKEIGGEKHKLVEGDKCIISIEFVEKKEKIITYLKGKLLNKPGYLIKPSSEIYTGYSLRNCSPVCFRMLHFIIHSVMYILNKDETKGYFEKHFENDIDNMKINQIDEYYLFYFIIFSDFVELFSGQHYDLHKLSDREKIEDLYNEKVVLKKLNFILNEVMKYKKAIANKTKLSYYDIVRENYSEDQLPLIPNNSLQHAFTYHLTSPNNIISNGSFYKAYQKNKSQINVLSAVLFDFISCVNSLIEEYNYKFTRQKAKEIKINSISEVKIKEIIEKLISIWNKISNEVTQFKCRQLPVLRNIIPDEHSISFLLLDDKEPGYGMYIAGALEYLSLIQNEVLDNLSIHCKEVPFLMIDKFKYDIQYIGKENTFDNEEIDDNLEEEELKIAIMKCKKFLSYENIDTINYQLELFSFSGRSSNIIEEISEKIPQVELDKDTKIDLKILLEKNIVFLIDILTYIESCMLSLRENDYDPKYQSYTINEIIASPISGVVFLNSTCEIVSLHREIEILIYDNKMKLNIFISTDYSKELGEDQRKEIENFIKIEEIKKELIDVFKVFTIRQLVIGSMNSSLPICDYISKKDMWSTNNSEEKIESITSTFPNCLKISNTLSLITYLEEI